MKCFRLRAVVSLCALTSMPASAQRLAKPTIDTVNHHILRVMNAGSSAWIDTNGWKLVYERTVQPSESSPGMLEKPTQVLLLPDGRVVVAQRDPALIKLYDAKGQFVRNIGREGEGPGEYRAPKLALYRDTIVVHDARLGRAALITADGRFVRQFLTNVHFDGPPISVDTRGRLRVETNRASAGPLESQWVYFDLNGNRLDSIIPPVAAKARNWEAQVPGGFMRQSVPFSPFNLYEFRPDGTVLYGGNDRYLFFTTRNGRDTVRMFGRSDVTAERIPSAVRDSAFNSSSINPSFRGVAKENDIPSTYAVWGGFGVDGNGNAWVSPGNPAGATRPFDVFDTSGRYLGAVPAPFGARFGSWAGDRVAILDTDGDGLPRVRIFRIDRRGH